VNDWLKRGETDRQKDSDAKRDCRPYFLNEVTEKRLSPVRKEPHEIRAALNCYDA